MDPAAFPTLDPELAPIVALLPDMSESLSDVPAARAMLDGFAVDGPVPGEELVETHEEQVGGGTVRFYRPRGASGRLPALLYLHGGGFCLGGLALEHPLVVELCHSLGAVVAHVDYRLAPEHPYPAGLEDCYAALQALAARDDVDPDRVAVHGQSAGGGLAAAVALLARDRRGPALCFQALGIPELDDRLDTPSMRTFTSTPMWTRGQAELSWQHYLAGQEADRYAAPARADDLGDLPPAYVVTCELDPLRDEGLTYAMRLLAAGVSVELHSFPGTVHGSGIARDAAVVRRMDEELLDALRRGLAPRPQPQP
ncbi:alpha/beta hydrolase [Nocardioides dongkuii]|uniref:alpha/beta hydrolase n=1 Tax=Nocardioides dongkuii TaxID=2760089 RepID=UPI0015F803F9|nr:alpha/beta hydrolase [Nocardioides dongkuii]